MAETDVLNPVKGYWPTLGDNPSWTYDWTRKKAINKKDVAARLGSPYSRDTGNAGHSFAWNWITRPYATIQRLEAFYDAFKHGYFTVIDWDGVLGGAAARHYVGRFTEPPYPQNIGYATWSAQGVQFQEFPTARMLVYPSNFAVDGHPIFVLDDKLNPRIAAMVGAWYPQVSPIAPATVSATIDGTIYNVPAINAPASYELINVTPAAGDWAQVQYVGWGFQLTFRIDPTFGVCTIGLDSVPCVTNLNLQTGAYTALAGAVVTVNAATAQYPNGSITVAVTNVPLDQHRVKITAAGGAAPSSVIFPSLEYIY